MFQVSLKLMCRHYLYDLHRCKVFLKGIRVKFQSRYELRQNVINYNSNNDQYELHKLLIVRNIFGSKGEQQNLDSRNGGMGE